MGRIQNLTDDDNVQGLDRLVGTDINNQTLNYLVRDVAQYVGDTLYGGLAQRQMVFGLNGETYPSGFVVDAFDVSFTAAHADGERVYIQDANTIKIEDPGSAKRASFFAHQDNVALAGQPEDNRTLVARNNRIILENESGDNRVIRIIDSVNAADGTITVTMPFDSGDMEVFSSLRQNTKATALYYSSN